MGIIYFTKNPNPIAGIQEGISHIVQQDKPISPESKVLVLLDILLPEGFPTSVNPASLLSLLDYLNTIPNTSITILPNAYWNTDPIKNLEVLGLKKLILAKKCQIADILEYRKQPLQYLSQFSYSILFCQTRIDPMLTVWTSYISLAFFNPKYWASDTAEEKLSDENFFKDWYQSIEEVLLWKQPDIVIEDMFEFAEGNGPLILSESTIKKTSLQIISTDLSASNAAVCTIFGITPTDHPILKYNIHFPSQLETVNNITIVNKELMIPISYKKPQTDLTKINIPGLSLLFGEIGDGLKYQLFHLLSTLKSICVRDAYHMGKWILLVGNNPPEPPENIPIIILGKAAIQSTNNYAFRRMIEKKKVLPELEIDNLIFRNDSILRDKIRQFEAHYENLKAEIAQKQNPLEREESTIQANKKQELTILKMRHKNRKNDLKIRFQNRKADLQNETPKIKLNDKILEIPGECPLGFDCLQYLVQYWPMPDIPGLSLYHKLIKTFYQYPTFVLKDFKGRMKDLQQSLKKELKIQYAPISAQTKLKLKELQTGYKTEVKTEAELFAKAKKTIAEKYRPQEIDIKERQKGQLKANIQEKKTLLQEKLAKKRTKQAEGKIEAEVQPPADSPISEENSKANNISEEKSHE